MTDDLDRLLRSSGERWRASLPPLPDLDAARARRARSRRWYVAGVAAAVLLVAGGISAGMAVLGHGDQRSLPSSAPTGSATASPTGSTTPAGVVPWAALPATHPTLPSSTTPASPDPAAAAGARPCGADDLTVLKTSNGPAMGTDYVIVRLGLVGASPCHLDGFPVVHLLNHGRVLDVPVRHATDTDDFYGEEKAVLVTSNAPATFRMSRSTTSCPANDSDATRVELPGISASFTIPGFGQTFCEPGDSTAPTISVGPIQPLRQKAAHVTSPYDEVKATGSLPHSARAGQPLDFTITLTSEQGLPLDPCPDYTIFTDAGQRRYALNCAAVPHRDAVGRPYLPAGVPVTFAMRLEAGVARDTKLGWRLVTPSGDVGVGSIVTVAGH